MLGFVFVVLCSCTQKAPKQGAPMQGEERVRELVTQFICAYHDWETSAYSRWQSNDGARTGNTLTEDGFKLMTQLRDEYKAALKPFVAESVQLACPGWGYPVRHDPEREEITSIECNDSTYLVRTSMTRKNGSVVTTDIHEYRIAVNEGEPRLYSIMWIAEAGDRFQALDSRSGTVQQ